jgi:hypothetical protein
VGTRPVRRCSFSARWERSLSGVKGLRKLCDAGVEDPAPVFTRLRVRWLPNTDVAGHETPAVLLPQQSGGPLASANLSIGAADAGGFSHGPRAPCPRRIQSHGSTGRPAAASVYRFRVPSKQAGKKPGVGGDHVHDAGGVRADPARGWSAGTLLLAPDEIAPNTLTKVFRRRDHA